eukprot:14105936-Ditylum_brightwellii.AAC.1
MQQQEEDIGLSISGDNVEQNFQEDPTTPMQEQAPRRSSRQRCPLQRMLESIQQEGLALSTHYDVLHEDEYKQKEQMQQLLAYLLQSNPDMMQFQQAMKDPDKDQFM